jgi:signal transduction histidine kinase
MKTSKFHIILLFAGMIWNFTFAQNYIHYTKKDGLAGNYVYSMTQDNEGFIWFLTDTGLSKFDGKTFKNFTTKEGLPANDIWHIKITRDGRVYYFSRSDELGYIENDSVYKFKASDGEMMNPNRGINQAGNNITFLGQYSNYHFTDTIWQAISGNRFHFKLLNKEIVYVEDSLRANARLEDTKGKLLFTFKKMTTNVMVQQLNDSLFVRLSLTAYEIVNLNTLGSKYKDLTSLPPVPARLGYFRFHWANNQLQLSGYNWLICFDNSLEMETVYNIPKHLNSAYNFKDKDGFIWLAASGNGGYKLPIGYQTINSFFNEKNVTKIKEIDGIIYTGVEGEGIYKIEDSTVSLWIKDKTEFWDITKIEEAIYYSFRYHLFIEKNVSLKKIERKKTGEYRKQFVLFKEDLFTEGFSGIGRVDKNIDYLKVYYDDHYYQGLFKQNDSLYSFSYKNMLYYNAEKDAFSEYKNEQIQKKLLTSITIDNQTYIGTEGDGLYLFSQGKLNKLINNDQSIINEISIEDKNSIWAVSEGVLLHFTKNKKEEFSVKRYNQINGFATNNVNDVCFNNGYLYIATNAGLTVFNKEEITENINFAPYIKSIVANGIRYPKDSLLIKYNKDLNLKVNFGAINYFDAENTTFYYQLSPLQRSWISTESGEINLFDLEPIDYTLHLKVTHNAIEKIIDVPISILPRWWQTRWFSLLVLSTALLVLGLIQWYVGRIIRIKKSKKIILEKQMAQVELKALRSQMNPHFVHNSLNAIQYYIQRNEVDLSENYLAKFSKLIRLFFEYSRKQNITIENEISLLTNYLEIEKLRFEEKFDFKITVDGKLELEQLFPSMILQPIVENAVNHGLFHKNKKGIIQINFTYIDDHSFQVKIEDDGIGINKAKKINKHTSKKHQSRSSTVIQERFDLLRQSNKWDINYKIDDLSTIVNTTGTRVTLTYNQLDSL